MPFQREAEAILEEWRAVQRELEAADPASPEANHLRAEAARLSDVYQRLVQMQRDTGGSPLPSFSEPSPSN
jgi:ubiquinone biosynthesis protein UbiJ